MKKIATKAFLLTTLTLLAALPLFAGGQGEGRSIEQPELSELKQMAEPELQEEELEAALYPESGPGKGIVTGDLEADAADEATGESGKFPGRAELQKAESITVDLERAVDLALEYNLTLKGKQLDLVKKRRAMSTVWNSFVPTVGVSATLGRMNEARSVGGLSPYDPAPTTFPGVGTAYDYVVSYSQEISPWSLSLGVNVDLMLNLALFDGITATRLSYESGLLSYEQARKQMDRDVRKNFYNLLLMQRNRTLFLQQIAAAESRYEQAQVNYRNGLVPELTMLQAQVAWENLKPALEAMDLGYDQALAGFKMTLGLSQKTELELEGSIETEPVELEAQPLIDDYLAGRLDIQSLVYGMKSLEVAKRSTINRAFTPNLMLGWSYDPSVSDPFDADTELFDGDSWNQQGGMLRITLAMQLEGFLPGSKTRVALADMDDDYQNMQLGLMQAIEGAEMEINSLVKSLKKSQSSMTSLQLNVELAQRAYRMAEEAYRAGSRELLEVQNSEIELNKAKYELLKEKYNYVTGLLDLQYALNTSMEEIKE